MVEQNNRVTKIDAAQYHMLRDVRDSSSEFATAQFATAQISQQRSSLPASVHPVELKKLLT
jgi:hypothetical protein